MRQKKAFQKMVITAVGPIALVLAAAGSALTLLAASPAVPAPASTADRELAIAFQSAPEPSMVVGKNTFRVTLEDPAGQPVSDAQVSLILDLPAWPIKRMPEIREAVRLDAAGEGAYQGSGFVPMAGQWQVTVVAKRFAREIGRRTLTVPAQ
jgi:hypothetical protein